MHGFFLFTLPTLKIKIWTISRVIQFGTFRKEQRFGEFYENNPKPGCSLLSPFLTVLVEYIGSFSCNHFDHLQTQTTSTTSQSQRVQCPESGKYCCHGWFASESPSYDFRLIKRRRPRTFLRVTGNNAEASNSEGSTSESKPTFAQLISGSINRTSNSRSSEDSTTQLEKSWFQWYAHCQMPDSGIGVELCRWNVALPVRFNEYLDSELRYHLQFGHVRTA